MYEHAAEQNPKPEQPASAIPLSETVMSHLDSIHDGTAVVQEDLPAVSVSVQEGIGSRAVLAEAHLPSPTRVAVHQPERFRASIEYIMPFFTNKVVPLSAIAKRALGTDVSSAKIDNFTTALLQDPRVLRWHDAAIVEPNKDRRAAFEKLMPVLEATLTKLQDRRERPAFALQELSSAIRAALQTQGGTFSLADERKVKTLLQNHPRISIGAPGSDAAADAWQNIQFIDTASRNERLSKSPSVKRPVRSHDHPVTLNRQDVQAGPPESRSAAAPETLSELDILLQDKGAAFVDQARLIEAAVNLVAAEQIADGQSSIPEDRFMAKVKAKMADAFDGAFGDVLSACLAPYREDGKLYLQFQTAKAIQTRGRVLKLDDL